MHVSSQPKFIQWLIYIIVFDVLSTLPFAKLRVEQRAWRFASIRLINIAVNIGFNLFFFLLCPYLIKEGIAVDIIASIYEPSLGIGYIFISNLIASAVMLVLLSPEIFKTRLSFHFELWKKMSRFGFPLLIGGLAYVTNEMAHRLLLEYFFYLVCHKIRL